MIQSQEKPQRRENIVAGAKALNQREQKESTTEAEVVLMGMQGKKGEGGEGSPPSFSSSFALYR